jgi:hypothetical protein
MPYWIALPARSGRAPDPDAVDAGLSVASLAPTLSKLRDSNGGIHRRDLMAAAEAEFPTSGGWAHLPTAFGELDLVNRPAGVAVSFQAGRAMTNNGALLATLDAAEAAGVRWLILAVPRQYKGTTTGARIVAQLETLARSPGIVLDLDGVGVVEY